MWPWNKKSTGPHQDQKHVRQRFNTVVHQHKSVSPRKLCNSHPNLLNQGICKGGSLQSILLTSSSGRPSCSQLNTYLLIAYQLIIKIYIVFANKHKAFTLSIIYQSPSQRITLQNKDSLQFE